MNTYKSFTKGMKYFCVSIYIYIFYISIYILTMLKKLVIFLIAFSWLEIWEFSKKNEEHGVVVHGAFEIFFFWQTVK